MTSEAVCSLSWGAEVLYRRLMSVADDHGRYYATPKLIRAACYPHQIDKVSDADVGKWIAECEQAALVSVYPAQDGKRYLQIAKFGQQIRSKSKFPDPVGEPLLAIASSREQLPANEHLVVFEGVSVSGGVSRERATPSRARKTPIPNDFAISERVRSWAAEKGFQRLDEHLEAFVSKAKAKAYTYADWDLAFMEAVREDWAKLRGNGRGSSPAGEAMTVPSLAADQTAEYLRSREMTKDEREAADRARQMVMSKIKVVSK